MVGFSFLFLFSSQLVTFRGDVIVEFETSRFTPGTFLFFLYPFIRHKECLVSFLSF